MDDKEKFYIEFYIVDNEDYTDKVKTVRVSEDYFYKIKELVSEHEAEEEEMRQKELQEIKRELQEREELSESNYEEE